MAIKGEITQVMSDEALASLMEEGRLRSRLAAQEGLLKSADILAEKAISDETEMATFFRPSLASAIAKTAAQLEAFMLLQAETIIPEPAELDDDINVADGFTNLDDLDDLYVETERIPSRKNHYNPEERLRSVGRKLGLKPDDMVDEEDMFHAMIDGFAFIETIAVEREYFGLKPFYRECLAILPDYLSAHGDYGYFATKLGVTSQKDALMRFNGLFNQCTKIFDQVNYWDARKTTVPEELLGAFEKAYLDIMKSQDKTDKTKANPRRQEFKLLPIVELEKDNLDWRVGSPCSQTDPEAFYPEKGGSTREAKAVCKNCDVKGECLEYALQNEERFGIWGGLSERERRKLKKRAS